MNLVVALGTADVIFLVTIAAKPVAVMFVLLTCSNDFILVCDSF